MVPPLHELESDVMEELWETILTVMQRLHGERGCCGASGATRTTSTCPRSAATRFAEAQVGAAAVSAVGETRPLAAALARFDEHGAGVAPQRVDRLVHAAPLTVSAALPVGAGLLAACVPAFLAARRAGAYLRVY